MRKPLLLISIILFTKNVWAQQNRFRYGIKIGADISRIEILPPLRNRTESYGTGIVAGGVIQVTIQKKLKIQIEPLYNFHTSTLKFNPNNGVNQIDLSLYQVSLPVQLSYFVFPDLGINAGGSVNYNFYLEQKVYDNYGTLTFNITSEIVNWQAGVLGGLSFYATEHVCFDVRYHRMLTNLYHKTRADDPTEYRLGFFQVSLGYRF